MTKLESFISIGRAAGEAFSLFELRVGLEEDMLAPPSSRLRPGSSSLFRRCVSRFVGDVGDSCCQLDEPVSSASGGAIRKAF